MLWRTDWKRGKCVTTIKGFLEKYFEHKTETTWAVLYGVGWFGRFYFYSLGKILQQFHLFKMLFTHMSKYPVRSRPGAVCSYIVFSFRYPSISIGTWLSVCLAMLIFYDPNTAASKGWLMICGLQWSKLSFSGWFVHFGKQWLKTWNSH